MLSEPKRLSPSARQAQTRELLQKNQQVTIPELAAMFSVSEMTVRRDLDKLQGTGQIRRTHGGAMPAERMEFEFDFTSRRQSNRSAKQAIAREAFKLVRADQRLILDTGTTTLELALLLRDFENITVITPSLAVASVLQFASGVETVLLGGSIRRGSPDLTGVVTEAVLDMFAVDIAFQGADGIAEDGTCYNADMRIANVDRKIRQRAEHTYVLADSSKIGRTALATNGRLDEVEALIVDSGVDPDAVAAFQEMGATVIIAEDK